MNQESGSCSLLTESCLALLQQENNWVSWPLSFCCREIPLTDCFLLLQTAISFESDHISKKHIQQAESLFQVAAMKEQAKFKVDSVPTIRFGQQGSQRENWPSERRPTMAVVSVVVAVGGNWTIKMCCLSSPSVSSSNDENFAPGCDSAARNHITNLSDLKAWLQSVSVDNTDEFRSNVIAFQVR